MTHRARIPLVALVGAALCIAACSDSTAPESPHFAQYLDSLYFATVGDSSLSEDVRASRAYIITQFEIDAAFGVSPTNLTVHTAAGTEHWSAYEYLSQEAGPHGIYSNILIATRDLHFRTYMYMAYGSDGSISYAVLNENDTVRTGLSSHDGSSTVSADGSECPSPVPINNPMISLINCTTATFSSSASIEFNDAPGLESAYRHFAFPRSDFKGERFLFN
jgi:hypothetical protein